MADTNNEKKTRARIPPRITKIHILQQAEELFLQHGFSRVTVDEIAHELGMSKKTIYLHFTDKKAIVKSIIQKNQRLVIKQIDNTLNNQELSFIQKLQKTLQTLTTFFSKMSPYFIRNIKRSYPELWIQIDEFKQKQGLKRVQLLVQEGIKEGVIRGDIPSPLLLQLYFFLIENIFTSERFAGLSYSAPELFEAAVKLIYGGILTDSARKVFFKGGSNE